MRGLLVGAGELNSAFLVTSGTGEKDAGLGEGHDVLDAYGLDLYN